MKKAYSKPQIMFENFTLSTNIALGCNLLNVSHAPKEQGCGLIISDRKDKGVLFNSTYDCSINADDGNYNGICYHVPEDYAQVIFTS